jgi:hypothetical protein
MNPPDPPMLPSPSPPPPSNPSPPDRTLLEQAVYVKALRQLYDSTGGEEWTHSTGWFVGSPCSNDSTPWYGIHCDEFGDIDSLSLEANNLQGTIPQSISVFRSMSRSLVLANNQLSGTLPSQLGKFTQLKSRFSLHHNKISGTIPTEMGQLSSVQDTFNLFWNRLSGTVPLSLGQIHSTDCSMSGDEIGSNYFTCPLPTLSEECSREITCNFPPPTAPQPNTPNEAVTQPRASLIGDGGAALATDGISSDMSIAMMSGGGIATAIALCVVVWCACRRRKHHKHMELGQTHHNHNATFNAPVPEVRFGQSPRGVMETASSTNTHHGNNGSHSDVNSQYSHCASDILSQSGVPNSEHSVTSSHRDLLHSDRSYRSESTQNGSDAAAPGWPEMTSAPFVRHSRSVRTPRHVSPTRASVMPIHTEEDEQQENDSDSDDPKHENSNTESPQLSNRSQPTHSSIQARLRVSEQRKVPAKVRQSDSRHHRLPNSARLPAPGDGPSPSATPDNTTASVRPQSVSFGTTHGGEVSSDAFGEELVVARNGSTHSRNSQNQHPAPGRPSTSNQRTSPSANTVARV